MDLTIDIDEYISEDEKKEICASAFKLAVVKRTESDFERILNNAGYHIVFDLIDDELKGNCRGIIKKQALKVINEISAHSVYRSPDAWNKNGSHGYDMLIEALNNNKDRLNSRIESLIDGLSDEALDESIKYELGDVIIERLIQSKKY